MRYYYKAKALDNLSINESHANTYSSGCLDYIPGSAVMGALACRLYRNRNFSREKLFSVFQGNDAVFSNVFPLKDGKPTLPVPMSLHYVKDESSEKANLENKCVSSADDSIKQYKQLREGLITSGGDFISVKHDLITRTAINDENQTAKEHTLHTQESIVRGIEFIGFIDVCDSLKNKFDGEIRSFLNSVIRVGNSRSSEFGRVKLEFMSSDDDYLSYGKPDKGNGKFVYLWCISDCEFISDTAMPSAVPLFSNVWTLADRNCSGEYRANRSFIRNSSIRHFNRRRGGLDGENILVRKGSVICFEITSGDFSNDDLKEIQKKGIGINRQYGYGQVIVNPSWIDERRIGNIENLFIADDKQCSPSAQLSEDVFGELNSNLSEWLDNEVFIHELLNVDDVHRHNDFVVELYDQLRGACVSSYSNHSENIGPSASQWSDIKNLVKKEKISISGKSKLSDALLSEIEDLCCGNFGKDIKKDSKRDKTSETDKKQWGATFTFNSENSCSFGAFGKFYVDFLKSVREEITVEVLIRQLEELCRHDLSTYREFAMFKRERDRRNSDNGDQE